MHGPRSRTRIVPDESSNAIDRSATPFSCPHSLGALHPLPSWAACAAQSLEPSFNPRVDPRQISTSKISGFIWNWSSENQYEHIEISHDGSLRKKRACGAIVEVDLCMEKPRQFPTGVWHTELENWLEVVVFRCAGNRAVARPQQTSVIAKTL
jgi:hypothetical protein